MRRRNVHADRQRLSFAGAAPTLANGEVLSLFDASRDDDRKTFQQELRFASKLDGPFNFVAGGFYQNDKVKFCVAQILGFIDLTSRCASTERIVATNSGLNSDGDNFGDSGFFM